MATQAISRKFPFIGKNGFDGGLSSENPVVIGQNQLIIADDILIGTIPTRRKRGGQEYYNTVALGISASPIRGNIEFWRTAGLSGNPVSDVFIHQDGKVWSIDDRNTAAVDRTGALVLDPTSVPSYQPFGNGTTQYLYFCSTITADGYNKWDGVSASAVAATPPPDGVGKYLCSHLGRMIMAGNDDFPFRLYLSSALDPEDWSSISPSNGTSLDLDDNGDPEGITGICSFQNRLYAFTRRSTYEITGTTADTFVVQRISNGIGCVSHASIVQVPNDVIFASDRGVHSLRQLDAGRQTNTQFLSRDIQRLWTELVNATKFKQFMASYDENINSYMISVVSGSDTVNKDILVYNIEFGTWTRWVNVNARSISTVLISNKKKVLIGTENGKLSVLGIDNRQDFGADYNSEFKTGVLYPGGDITVQKRFLSITVLASTNTQAFIDVNWNVDGKRGGNTTIELNAGEDLLGSTFILGESKLGIGQYLPYTISIDEVGYGIQLDFLMRGAGDTEIYGFILEVDNANTLYANSTS